MKSILFFAFLIFSVRIFADQADNLPAINFSEVVKGKIYRSGEPALWEYEGFAKKYGIKTIINMQTDMVAVEAEIAEAAKHGIKVISLPIVGYLYPTDKDISKIYKELTDKKNYPVLIHCYHGRDRTGLLVGFYRVFKQNWGVEQAYSEMLKFDFLTYNWPLQMYWEDKTRHRTDEY
jgi:protein tyrosine/serine phosphatase